MFSRIANDLDSDILSTSAVSDVLAASDAFRILETIGQNTCICTKTNLAKNKQLFMTPATNFVTTLHQTFTWALSLTTNCLITGAKARF